jgi:hypothetical protein
VGNGASETIGLHASLGNLEGASTRQTRVTHLSRDGRSSRTHELRPTRLSVSAKPSNRIGTRARRELFFSIEQITRD